MNLPPECYWKETGQCSRGALSGLFRVTNKRTSKHVTCCSRHLQLAIVLGGGYVVYDEKDYSRGSHGAEEEKASPA